MAATTPIKSSTAATRGNKNASSAMDSSPMRRVDEKANDRKVVTSRATVSANIGGFPDVVVPGQPVWNCHNRVWVGIGSVENAAFF